MNAILICKICKSEVDKGVPVQIGQDDSLYVCEDCAFQKNRAELIRLTPTIQIDGDAK